MTVVNEKLIDEAHQLARWIGLDQFKIKLPIQDSDWSYQHYDAAKHPSLDECVKKSLETLQQQCDAKGTHIDPSSIKINKDTFYYGLNHSKGSHRVHIIWKYTTAKPRECTFTTIAAVEIPHDDDEPNMRTYRILGCSRGQNTWGESKWFYAATIGDQGASNRVTAIKHDSLESAIKLCKQRVKRQVMKALMDG